MDTAPRTLTVTEARAVAALVHVGGILFLFLPALVVFVLFPGRDGWLREQVRAALNFQLTVLAAYIVGFASLWLVIGYFIVPTVAVASVVLSIVCAIAAHRGEPARYVLSLPFIR
jgi:uncharacterized Tic20 family protein